MKKLMFFLLITSFFAFESKAQDYSTGIGLRGGPWTGLTVKHFLNNKAAVEGLFDSRWQGFSVTGLYEVHNRAFDVDRLNWYYGVGAHIGFYDTKYVDWGHNTGNYSIVGADGILGLEYNFREIPFNLSLDWKPTINLFGYSGFWGDSGALSIRYIF